MTSADTEKEKFWHNENEQNKGTYQKKSKLEIYKIDGRPEKG